MILSEIEAEIFRSLKEPSSGGHWTEAEILRRINIGQRKVVRITGCLEAVFTAPTVVGQAPYAKPTKSLRTRRVYYGDSGKRLYPTTSSDLDIMADTGKIGSPWSDEQDEPTHYFETPRNIYLYPKPDAIETFGIECLLRPDDLVNPTDTPFNAEPFMEDYHDALVSFVLWRCLLEDGNELFKEHKQDFIDSLMSIKTDLKRKEDSLGTFGLIRVRRGVGKNPLPFMDD